MHVHIQSRLKRLLCACDSWSLNQTVLPCARHRGLSGHLVGQEWFDRGYYVQDILSVVWSPLISFSNFADKHLSSYNWHDTQPECVIFFFMVQAASECCSESRGACFWPSAEKKHWRTFLLLTLLRLSCACMLAYIFLYYPCIRVCFLALLLLCSQGLKTQFIMVWREISTGLRTKELS